MDPDQIRQSYDLIVSLGTACQPAWQLRRLGLRAFAGPLDWTLTESLTRVTQLIERRFARFMKLENLRLDGVHATSHRVIDTAYDCASVHDFPLDVNSPGSLASHPEFKAKMERRISRLLAVMDDPAAEILFIRHYGIPPDPASHEYLVHEFRRLTQTLDGLVRGSFRVLAVTDVNNPEFTRADWGLDRVCVARIPNPPERWEGDDEAWEQLLDGISLRNKNSG